ncbi:Gelsolin-like domain [Trinorchestia longiramus]|nr:Gelsolin-like domain [Trinorchestia longiramus]
MDPAFESAGQSAGLEIWRIENFEVVPYPREKYGQFYEGDSYIVLYTDKEEGTGRSHWDVHFWLGSETSQDEAGACAIKAVELDDCLGGVPVQHREVQGHESALFLSRFKGGVRYLKGGVASGFTHVDPDAPYPARLFHVKGRRNVRVSQVELSVSSMNQSDCFILDAGKEVYVYMGPSCRRIERLKAIQAGNGIRDEDHAGKAKVIIIDETAGGGEIEAFFEALGGGCPDDVAPDSAEDDSAHERSQEKVVSLHRVWEEDGEVQSEQVAQKPLAQSSLGSGDCYLLDTGGSGLFVWIGRESSRTEKVRSMELATKYLERQGLPKWTKVERICEGTEPTVFKQYFKSWKESESAIGFGRVYTQSQIAASTPEGDFDVTSLHASKRRLLAKNAGPAFGFMPDDGNGTIEVFRVEDFELQPVDEATVGFFFGGDSYVIKYTYDVGGVQKYIIYFWQGVSSSQDEKAASAIHAVRLDNELNGKAVQVRVVQGYEPAHFLRMFKGRMVLFMGGKASGFKNVHDHDTYDVDGTRLFQVRGTCELDVRAEQRAEVAASLNSDDVFVLETPSNTYVWVGKGASDEEKAMAESVCGLVSPGREVVTLAEGEEDDDFWSALGGKGDYQTMRDLDTPLLSPRLFHCSVSPAGCLRVHEVSIFSQEDLNEDDVMVLDSGDEVYVWIGKGASDEEKEKSWQMAKDYIETDPTDRSLEKTVILRVNQGQEPVAFTSTFPAWNPNMWEELPSYEDIKALIEARNAELDES